MYKLRLEASSKLSPFTNYHILPSRGKGTKSTTQTVLKLLSPSVTIMSGPQENFNKHALAFKGRKPSDTAILVLEKMESIANQPWRGLRAQYHGIFVHIARLRYNSPELFRLLHTVKQHEDELFRWTPEMRRFAQDVIFWFLDLNDLDKQVMEIRGPFKQGLVQLLFLLRAT